MNSSIKALARLHIQVGSGFMSKGASHCLCGQAGQQALPKSWVEPQAGLCDWVSHWLCSVVG